MVPAATSGGSSAFCLSFPKSSQRPRGEASDSQAGRAASREGFIDSQLGVHHSLSSLPASGEDMALNFPGTSARGERLHSFIPLGKQNRGSDKWQTLRRMKK